MSDDTATTSTPSTAIPTTSDSALSFGSAPDLVASHRLPSLPLVLFASPTTLVRVDVSSASGKVHRSPRILAQIHEHPSTSPPVNVPTHLSVKPSFLSSINLPEQAYLVAAQQEQAQLKAMASMMDSKNNGYNRNNTGYGAGNNMYGSQYGARGQTGQGYGMNQTTNVDLAALAHSFQGLNMPSQTYPAPPKSVAMSTASSYGGVSIGSMPSSMYGAAANQYMYPNAYGAGMNNHSPTNMYTPHAGQYMGQFGYGYQHHDNSPLSQNWTPTTGATVDVPTLVTPRRDSISSNENDQPATPSYANYAGFPQVGGVAINRSPSGDYTHGTPSPTSMVAPYGVPMVKQPPPVEVSPRIKLLVSQDPPIPRAIPAPSSPQKPLDRALENQRGETNVYIRGLLPQTTDEMLEAWGSRFGDIKSSKSIIDLNSGLCKGFGFVKYHNYEDAENCIRGFYYLGYEESFYSKLKTFADEKNTNLYVSNLPKAMNEHDLAQLFLPHKVCSSRILRDKNGHGRGVGFARFETRDACEEVIKEWTNKTITSHGEETTVNVRYADTPEQKSLKTTTQAARSFRSAECPSSPGSACQMFANPSEDEFATSAWRHGRLPYAGTTLNELPNPPNTEFDQYLGTTANVPFSNQRWAQQRQFSGRQHYMGQGSSTMMHATAGADAETSHGHSASDATVEATKPSSPAHDSANADQLE